MKLRHQPYVVTLEWVKEEGVAKEGDGSKEYLRYIQLRRNPRN